MNGMKQERKTDTSELAKHMRQATEDGKHLTWAELNQSAIEMGEATARAWD